MNILSIQSHVAFGHVGNAAAVFALQRLGHEVWPVHTVQYSNHPGYGAFGGKAMTPGDIADVIRGLDDLGALARCDAVLSGYLGDPAIGRVVLDAVARVKAANPDAVYLCDPVMGDRETGLYVDTAVPEFLKSEALVVADIVTPNVFELEILAGGRVDDAADAYDALDRVRAAGHGVAVLTGLVTGDTSIEAIGVESGAAFSVPTPIIATETRPDGAGDLFAALFLAWFLESRELGTALSQAISSVHAVLDATVGHGDREMRIIGEQAALVAPPRIFPARTVR